MINHFDNDEAKLLGAIYDGEPEVKARMSFMKFLALCWEESDKNESGDFGGEFPPLGNCIVTQPLVYAEVA